MNPEFHINNTVGRNPLQAKWKYKDLRTLGLKLIMIKECGCYVCHYLYCRKSDDGNCSAIDYDGVN